MELIRKKMKLGDVLVNSNTITEEQLNRALELQKGTGKKLGEVLVDENMVNEESIAKALSNQLHLEWIDLNAVNVNLDILDLIPASVLKKNRIFPFELLSLYTGVADDDMK